MSSGVAIGLATALGCIVIVLVGLGAVYWLRHTERGRILLSRARPGEFDDEEQLLLEEEDAVEQMDDIQRQSYFRAKAFQQANPPDSIATDISLSQFLAIQEKGISAWEFEPELELANCFVEARTEIAFYDCECSVQSNLPVPKQNEVYYWEAKLFDKPDTTAVAVGMTTKPYPMFRLPGYHRHSVAYVSDGTKRHNQPFKGVEYAPRMMQGDVVGVGYKPRTGTLFFTRNGKKLEDVAHGMKMNLFPTIGANGPCTVHVNLGQAGFVFIEANVKKWGLAPQTGSLAPPPPYGSEQGSVLLEAGRRERYSSSRSQPNRLPEQSPPSSALRNDISLNRMAPHHTSTPVQAPSTPRSPPPPISPRAMGSEAHAELTPDPPAYTSPPPSLHHSRSASGTGSGPGSPLLQHAQHTRP